MLSEYYERLSAMQRIELQRRESVIKAKQDRGEHREKEEVPLILMQNNDHITTLNKVAITGATAHFMQ